MARQPETIAFWRGRLPHWEVQDGRYFVTIHTAGAIPAKGRRRIREISESLQSADMAARSKWLERSRRVFQEMERWLDRSGKADYLRRHEAAAAAIGAIEQRSEIGVWRMFEYVVMPNHIHLFFELLKGELKSTMVSFKRWTARESGTCVDLNGKQFWQREWFDHWSRSDEEDDRIAAYIRRNPETAGLVPDYKDWPYGSW